MLNIYNQNLELISVHIPKCGGTTFGDILHRIYVHQYRHIVGPFEIEQTPYDIRCIHGHFSFEPEWLEIYPNVKICTWIRNPVDRLISYYFYWGNYRFGPGMRPNPNHLKMKIRAYDIFEFAKQEFIKNKMFDFIEHISLDDIDFIGDISNYHSDLLRLAEIMNWKNPALSHYRSLNKTMYTKKVFGRNVTITDQDRKILEKILDKDMERYEYIKNYCYPCKKRTWWHRLTQKKKYLPS